jgi:hypothetical protein
MTNAAAHSGFTDMDSIAHAAELAKGVLREAAEKLEAKASEPERLAAARKAADEARDRASIEEPFDDQWVTIPAYDRNGDISAVMALPNVTAKELWGTRLCFDILDCGDDDDRINEVVTRLFKTVHRDTSTAFLIAASALSTIATLFVPQLIEDLEYSSSSNFDYRVRLAEARRAAWEGRVKDLRDDEESDR